MSRRDLLLTMAAWLGAAHAGAAAPDDAAAAWDTPLAITLPAPARTVALRPGTDVAAWLHRNRFGSARIVARGSAGSTVDVNLTDAEWTAAQESLCTQPEVAACETATCAAIQFGADIAAGSDHSADDVQARLLRNPPERVPLPDDSAGGAGTCSGPALVPPLDGGAAADSGASADGGAAAGGGGNLTLDLRGADPLGSGPGSSGSQPHGERPGDAGAARSFEFDVGSAFGAAGVTTLTADDVPPDTTDWTLQVSAGCTTVAVPLDGLQPAREPERVVALVSAGTAGAVAATYGLVVAREVGLTSTGETLAVFVTPNVASTVAQLLLDARVQTAQPEFIYRTTAEAGAAAADTPADDASTVGGSAAALEPAPPGHNDPYAGLTWGPAQSGALGLHPSALGAGNRIAVIDTGVASSHPELAGRIETVDVSERGWSDDAHGTAVAGIIAAAADNAVGSFGVAPRAAILAIKACQPKEPGGLAARCWTSTLVKALDVAITEDAAIINMSLAGPPDGLLERYVGLAVEQGRLVVAGAGNGGPFAKPAFPAAIPGVLAVTAVDVNDFPYPQANVGSYVDLAAPGVDIVSPAPDGGYPPLSGTSMAAAHVSGIAALLKELAPALDGPMLRALLTDSGRDLGEPGSDAQFGAGLVDACRAAATATSTEVTCAGSGPIGGSADADAL